VKDVPGAFKGLLKTFKIDLFKAFKGLSKAFKRLLKVFSDQSKAF
jgi:hypothetical protein